MKTLYSLTVLAQMKLIMMTTKKTSLCFSKIDGEKYFLYQDLLEFHLLVRQVGVHFHIMSQLMETLWYYLRLTLELIKMETLDKF